MKRIVIAEEIIDYDNDYQMWRIGSILIDTKDKIKTFQLTKLEGKKIKLIAEVEDE